MNWSSITHTWQASSVWCIWRSRTFQGYDVHIKTTAGRSDRASWNITSEGSAHRVSASYPELYKHKWSTMNIDIPLLPSQIRDRVESPESMSWFSSERMKKATLSTNRLCVFGVQHIMHENERYSQETHTALRHSDGLLSRPQPAFP